MLGCLTCVFDFDWYWLDCITCDTATGYTLDSYGSCVSDGTVDSSTINCPQDTILVSFFMDGGSEMLECFPCKIMGCADNVKINSFKYFQFFLFFSHKVY